MSSVPHMKLYWNPLLWKAFQKQIPFCQIDWKLVGGKKCRTNVPQALNQKDSFKVLVQILKTVLVLWREHWFLEFSEKKKQSPCHKRCHYTSIIKSSNLSKMSVLRRTVSYSHWRQTRFWVCPNQLFYILIFMISTARSSYKMVTIKKKSLKTKALWKRLLYEWKRKHNLSLSSGVVHQLLELYSN